MLASMPSSFVRVLVFVAALAACERTAPSEHAVDAGPHQAIDAGSRSPLRALALRPTFFDEPSLPSCLDKPEDERSCELGVVADLGPADTRAQVRAVVEDAHFAANGWEQLDHELWLVGPDGGTAFSTVVLGRSSSSSLDGNSTNSRSVDDVALRGGQLVVTRTSKSPKDLRRKLAKRTLTLRAHHGQLIPTDVGPVRALDEQTDGCFRVAKKPGPMNEGGPGCWGDEEYGFCLAIVNRCAHAVDAQGLVREVPGGYDDTFERVLVSQPCVVPAGEHALLQGDFSSGVEGFAFWVPRCATRNLSEEVSEFIEQRVPRWRVHFGAHEVIATHPTDDTIRLEVGFSALPPGAPNRVATTVRVTGTADTPTLRLQAELEALTFR